MQKILIVYATWDGQTEKVAGAIAGHLTGAGHEVALVNARDSGAVAGLDLARFDKIVVGASFRAGTIEKEMLAFLRNHQTRIAAMPHTFFLVLMSAATKNPARRAASLADARQRLESKLPVSFGHIEMIAGALKYTKYNWFIRWVIKRIAQKEGGETDTSRDHEYTDWDQVADFARRLVE